MESSLSRKKSGRDPRKGDGQRKALESSTVPDLALPKSYNLIVCGATNHLDGFIFSDFMGFSMALREQGVGGDFISCFPLEKHFMYLKNEHKPPIDTIKFGKAGPNGDRYVYSYSRHAYLSRQYWFRQVGADILLNDVKDWITQKTQQARNGDVVNIVFECHGSRDRGLKIGTNTLQRYVFRDLISGFQDGVQINAIMDACHSGPFVNVIRDSTEEHRYAAAASDQVAWSFTRSASNRIRNSRFSQAFVQSLAKLNLPGTPRRKVTWRLKDHEDFIDNLTTRNITPGARGTAHQFHIAPPLDGISAVEDMVFRKKVDVLFDPQNSSCRRRMEWPAGDQSTWQVIQGNPASERVSQSAKELVDGELSKCDASTGYVPDIQVLDQLYVHHPKYRSLLRNLYWRARRQSAVWQVFKLLLHRQYIDPICLHLPIDFDQCSPSDTIVNLLEGFSFLTNDVDEILEQNIPLQSAQWDKDLKWLAVMIIRGGENITDILNLIAASGVLGDYNTELLDEFKKQYSWFTFYRDPCDCALDPANERFNQKFGLWLPHGIETEKFQTQFSECERHFELIEIAFQQSEQQQQFSATIDQHSASEGHDNELLTVPVEWSPNVSL